MMKTGTEMNRRIRNKLPLMIKDNSSYTDNDNEVSDSHYCNFHHPPMKIKINIDFGKKLKYLELKAMEIQYQLACLSTLGGAYHLCNNPKIALLIAYQQEQIGLKLSSPSITIRAKVFQATNYYLLGFKNKSRNLFKECKDIVRNKNCSEDLLMLIEASEIWLEGRSNANISQEYNIDRKVLQLENA